MCYNITIKEKEGANNMTRLENVIKEIKSVRVGENRAWIFDEDGKIKDDVLCGEVLDLLEEMKDYEIEVDDDFWANY